MASCNSSVTNGNSDNSDTKCSKDLLRNEIITREDHIRSLVQSKGPPKTFQVKSSALAQAKMFLPKFAEAEKARVAAGDEISIEAEDSGATGPLIEMNFALAGPVSSSDDSSSDSESSGASSESEADGPTLKAGRSKRTGTTNGSTLILELSQKNEESRQNSQ